MYIAAKIQKSSETAQDNAGNQLDNCYNILLQNHRVDLPRDTSDPHSIHVRGVFQVPCNQYIGETNPYSKTGFSPFDAITALVRNESRLILRANAGAGKSTLCIQLSQHLEAVRCTKVVILEPTTAIANQIGADFANAGVNAPVLDNAAREADIKGGQSSKVVICCYDSLVKLGADWIDAGTLVVVDEYHQLIGDLDYRNGAAFYYASEQIQRAGRILMLSATPNELLTLPRSIDRYFGFKMAMGVADVQQSLSLQPVIYSGRRKDIPAMIIERLAAEGASAGVTCIKFDSIDNLESAKHLATVRGLSAEYFCSKRRAQKEENRDYKSLMQTGKFDSRLDVVLYTTLLEAGVSIKDPVKLTALVDVTEWSRAVQLMSRPRYNADTHVNEHQLVELYRSAEAIKKESEGGAGSVGVTQRFRALKARAEQLADYKNGHGNGGALSMSVSTDTVTDKRLTIEAEQDGKTVHVPNSLWILHELHKAAQAVPFSLMLRRIQRFDNRVTVLEPKYIEVDKCDDLEAYRGNQKAKAEAEQLRLNGLLRKHFDLMTALCLRQCQNRAWKEKTALRFPRAASVDRADVEQFKQEHGIKGTKNVRRLIDSYDLITSDNAHIKTADVLSFVCTADAKTVSDHCDQLQAERRRFFNSVSAKDLDANSKFFADREQAVSRLLNQHKRNVDAGKGKEFKSAEQWTEQVNKALEKVDKRLGRLSKKKALALVRHLYEVQEVKTREKGKQVFLYAIRERRTLQDIRDLTPVASTDVVEGALLGGSD